VLIVLGGITNDWMGVYEGFYRKAEPYGWLET